LEIGRLDLYLWADGVSAPVPVTIILPDETTITGAIQPPDSGATVQLPQVVFADLQTQFATGKWVVEVPAAQLSASDVADLILLFTYRVAS
jgi:hypothetical protein